jgi:hypothetical protein
LSSIPISASSAISVLDGHPQASNRLFAYYPRRAGVNTRPEFKPWPLN